MQETEFQFDNSYARLPERFYAALPPTKVKAPQLIVVNDPLAEALGLDPAFLRSPQGVEVLGGNAIPEGSEPLAMAYAGHQFGGFVPQLGDGRAILLGEVIDRDGVRQDIHLKGAGRTPFSRGGDGRAALGPVLREYIVSNFMATLGIPTTRALAAVTTGEGVYREEVLPGAILTRVAQSHLRVGTFEYFAARRDTEALEILVDFAINRHFPDLIGNANPAKKVLERVMKRQSALVAKWISVGFIHGVMNTDNTAIAGETIDYGPCAFMDTYSPDKVFSYIDQGGRYAFMNQPNIIQWNLAQLAQCLLPLMDDTSDKALGEAKEMIGDFPDLFIEDLGREFAAKLAINCPPKDAMGLAFALMDVMSGQLADFTLTFRHLANALEEGRNTAAFTGLFEQPSAVKDWLGKWRAQVAKDNDSLEAARERLLSANPAVIARNHLVQEVITAAETRLDFDPLHALLAELVDPFADRPEGSKYMRPPQADEEVKVTFCGT